MLRLGARRGRREAGAARVDARTKRLLTRVQRGEVAVIDHEDLDRVAADGLVARGVAAVVNASPSITGRYPNQGPMILMEAGIPLVDGVGELVMAKIEEGGQVRLEGDRVYADGRLVGVGTRQTEDSIRARMVEAEASLADQLEAFAKNTLDFIEREQDLLFGGAGMPELERDLAGRHALVVVRGYNYREDLAALRSYIREVKPVLIGVDGGADALLEAGYRPDIVVGDMDSVSEAALSSGAEVVLHAYPDGRAPGRERVERMGLAHKEVRSPGMSEDVAYLLAHEKGAELIVSVGSHGNLREFLDKGRAGMSSTFLVRLRVGEILVDAKGVSRMYRGRIRGRDMALLVGAALFSMVAVTAVSQPLRLFFKQAWELLRQALFDLF